MGELKSRAHCKGQNCYHLIWSPKFRIHMLKGPTIRRGCNGVLRMIAMQQGYLIHEMRVLQDHIHMFVELPPRVSVSEAMQYLKGKSSRILRRNYPWLRQFKCLWAGGFFHRSVGNVTGDVIEHYISHSQGSYKYFDQPRKYHIPAQTRLSGY